MKNKIVLLALISVFLFSCREDESLDGFYGTTKVNFRMQYFKHKLLTVKVTKITLINNLEQGVPRQIQVSLDENDCIKAVYGTYVLTVIADITYETETGEIKELKNQIRKNEAAYVGRNARPIDIEFTS